jgi:uncharacterized protein (DUF488 family)
MGHGARPVDAFVALLRDAGVARLIDVRTRPGSRRHPHFGRAAISRSLAEAGIADEWWPELGGFRTPLPDSPHTALGVDAFRGYADHMASAEFRDALSRLMAAAAAERVAVMCAEADWRRCHRRMIADALTVAGFDVRHIVDGGLEPHERSPQLRIEGDRLVYDVAAGQASLDV